jgi:NAD(P)-dependent dehydrogenase (short-subunit alcohol dehydrogenase family)
MTTKQKMIIVTGASQGIGAAAPNLFLDRGYNVVGNSREIGRKNELPRSDSLALADGDIGLISTAKGHCWSIRGRWRRSAYTGW